MNHNFLPFEVTKLLPKENPYEVIKVWSMYPTELYSQNLTWQGDKTKPMLLDYGVSLQYHSDYTVRDAWTVLDALTFLEEQYGIHIEVYCNFANKSTVKYGVRCVLNCRNKDVYVKIHTLKDILEELSLYESRIEAYTEGIRHCLNLIKK